MLGGLDVTRLAGPVRWVARDMSSAYWEVRMEDVWLDGTDEVGTFLDLFALSKVGGKYTCKSKLLCIGSFRGRAVHRRALFNKMLSDGRPNSTGSTTHKHNFFIKLGHNSFATSHVFGLGIE